MERPGYAVRVPEPHEYDALLNCVETSFAERLSPVRREQLLAGLDPERALAAFDNAELVGTCAGYGVELTTPGLGNLPALALADVTVLPTHRRRGVLGALLRRSLEGAHGRGETVALLEASEGAIYARFGFGPATTRASFAVERSAAALVGSGLDAVRGRVVLLGQDQAAEAFPLVFDAARRRRPGEIGRNDWWWEELFAPAFPADGPPRFYAAYEEHGSIDGYAVYEVQSMPGPRREVVLEECCATTDGAYTALFSYLLGIDLTDGLRTGPRPLDEPLRHLLADPRALRTREVRDGAWLRLVDLRRALEQRGYAREGRVVLEFSDDLCHWNAGRIELEVGDDGRAEVRQSTADAELSLDASAMATIYLGGCRATELRRAGRILEGAAGTCERLDQLLYCEPTPFCSTL